MRLSVDDFDRGDWKMKISYILVTCSESDHDFSNAKEMMVER